MQYNDKLYTKEADVTISTWYVFAWYGPRIAVSPVRNAKLKDYKRYCHMDDIGERVFVTRKAAKSAPDVFYHEKKGI